jgi:hypothetical protein
VLFLRVAPVVSVTIKIESELRTVSR